MIAGTREAKTSNQSYRTDKLYPFAKAFVEATQSILDESSLDFVQEPQRALRKNSNKQALKKFFVENYIDEADVTKSVEEIEDLKEQAEAQFENDYYGIMNEASYMSDYAPMIGMALPIHKLILMNNAFANGGGIQKVTAVNPSFTISLERRFLITPQGRKIDMFLEQNEIAAAIAATAPVVKIPMTLPQQGGSGAGDVDVLGVLGGSALDELSVDTHVSGIYIAGVYIDAGDRLPVADADGRLWVTTKGEVADEDTKGTYNVWFPVKIEFTPNYGKPNKLERTLQSPVTIKYKALEGTDVVVKTLADTLFGAMDNNVITLTALKGSISQVILSAKLSTSNAMLDTCSVKWDVTSQYVEIPDATPINTTITPEEVKDIAAMYDANQVTKIMSMTKTVLSEKKDMEIKNFLDDSYQRLDERSSFQGEFDFAVPEGYAHDWVLFRNATFMDYFDDLVTRMLYVWNDPNMTVSVFGDPRIVRKITPKDYAYQAPSTIGPVTLDYTQTVVNTSDNRVYNFIGADKLRFTNELWVLLNPRNTDRLCYRLYDYQLYMSNEIRNSANPALPSVHSFERYKMVEYQPVFAKLSVKNASGMRNNPNVY